MIRKPFGSGYIKLTARWERLLYWLMNHLFSLVEKSCREKARFGKIGANYFIERRCNQIKTDKVFPTHRIVNYQIVIFEEM